MTGIFPFPVVSACLLVLWLLLNNTLSLAHILAGSLAALIGGWAFGALRPPKARPRRLAAILGLAVVVATDIVRSNIAAAGVILRPNKGARTSGFVDIPLELRDPYALATLACIITSTPGTLWVEFNAGSGKLTIHVLDLVDPTAWVSIIKGRYERRLLDIFA